MMLKLLMRMRMRMLLLRRRRLRLRTIHLIRDVSRCSVPGVTTIRRILNLLLLRRWLLLRLLLRMLLFVFGRTLANQRRSVRRECLQIFLFRCFGLLLVNLHKYKFLRTQRSRWNRNFYNVVHARFSQTNFTRTRNEAAERRRKKIMFREYSRSYARSPTHPTSKRRSWKLRRSSHLDFVLLSQLGYLWRTERTPRRACKIDSTCLIRRWQESAQIFDEERSNRSFERSLSWCFSCFPKLDSIRSGYFPDLL